MATVYHNGRILHLSEAESEELRSAVKSAIVVDESAGSRRVLRIVFDPALESVLVTAVGQLLGRSISRKRYTG